MCACVSFNVSVFQAVAASVLLYGCTTWTLAKPIKKKLDGNYTRILRVVLNKSLKQHPYKTAAVRHLLLSRKQSK